MKTRRYSYIVVGIVLGAALGLQADAKPAANHRLAPPAGMAFSIPTDSFLRAPVNTVRDLVHQVNSNPDACKRYAAFLHIPASSVASYFQSNVAVRRLKKSDAYTVYMVRANGLVYPVTMSLEKGTQVFTRNGGDPVLLCDSGNPLKPYEMAVETQTIIQQRVIEVPGPPIERVLYLHNPDADVPVRTATPIYKVPASESSTQGNADLAAK